MAGLLCSHFLDAVSGQLQTIRELIGSVNTCAFTGTDSHSRLDRCRDGAA